jgi:hypothetical protein
MENPVDPHLYLQQIAVRLRDLDDREQLETILDELEYLYDILDPSVLEGAETLMSQVRRKLGIGY